MILLSYMILLLKHCWSNLVASIHVEAPTMLHWWRFIDNGWPKGILWVMVMTPSYRLRAETCEYFWHKVGGSNASPWYMVLAVETVTPTSFKIKLFKTLNMLFLCLSKNLISMYMVVAQAIFLKWINFSQKINCLGCRKFIRRGERELHASSLQTAFPKKQRGMQRKLVNLLPGTNCHDITQRQPMA